MGALSDTTVARIIARHGNELLCVARQISLCAADAEDAYQSALEVLLTKAPAEGEEQLVRWLMVVTRNEALMIRRRRKRVEDASFEEIAADWSSESPSPAERVVEGEALGRQRESLRRLAPDQLRCLLLKADGMTYAEISKVTGISYASVNRYLTEGRRAYRAMLGRIASGAECERIEPLLSAIADDAASEEQYRDAGLHLEHCAACRAALADFRAAPSDLAALFPVAVATANDPAGMLRQASDFLGGVFANVQERVAAHAVTAQQVTELAPAKKAAALAAVAVAAFAGGATIERATSDEPGEGPAREPAAQIVPGPTLPAGEVVPQHGDAGDEREAPPREPSEAEVLSATARDAAAEPPAGDAGAVEDPFADQPQFDAPPESSDTQTGDSYGGLAP